MKSSDPVPAQPGLLLFILLVIVTAVAVMFSIVTPNFLNSRPVYQQF
jgi:hypothetical protein